jgi:hypothetical protein
MGRYLSIGGLSQTGMIDKHNADMFPKRREVDFKFAVA